MKYLTDYTQKATTNLLNNMGAFFAFSDSQFNEHKKEGIKYVHMGAGLICPKEKAPELSKELQNISKLGIEEDIKENGIRNIIERELNNYECFYTHDIDPAVSALKRYGVSEQEVLNVFNDVKNI